ncbi:MAG TPA: LysE family translocator [Gaiellaceae bacterium]
MPTPETLALFTGAALALIVVPGPAVLYIVATSIDQGRRAGLVSAAGILTGGTVHIAAATIGLSSLLVSSATAFEAVKLVGAAYLVYLGARRLLTRVAVEPVERERRPLGAIFRRGVVVNVLNPKTALFFLAFLPQFVDPDRGAAWLQIAIFGVTFVGLAWLSDSVYALAAGTAAHRLRGRAFRAVQRWVSGSIFVALGAVAVRAER